MDAGAEPSKFAEPVTSPVREIALAVVSFAADSAVVALAADVAEVALVACVASFTVVPFVSKISVIA